MQFKESMTEFVQECIHGEFIISKVRQNADIHSLVSGQAKGALAFSCTLIEVRFAEQFLGTEPDSLVKMGCQSRDIFSAVKGVQI